MERDDNGQMFLEQTEEEYTLAFGSFEEDFKQHVVSQEKDNGNLQPAKTPF